MSEYEGDYTTIDAAYTAARTQTDARNFNANLERLHAQHRTWNKVASELGVSPATLRRYRAGSYKGPKGRRPVSRSKLMPKISKALGSSRPAVLRGTDWRRLRVHARWIFDGGRGSGAEQEQNMDLGHYVTDPNHPGWEEGLSQAYLNGPDAFNTAVDHFLSDVYVTHFTDAHLTGVSRLEV